jgi:hypothetical protein
MGELGHLGEDRWPDGGPARHLDPSAEDYPAWSPNGTQIALLRYFAGTARGWTINAAGTIQLVSPMGGAGPPAVQSSRAAAARVVPRRPLASVLQSGRSGRPWGRRIPSRVPRHRRGTCGDASEAAGLRRLACLLARWPDAGLRFMPGRPGQSGLRRLPPAPRLRTQAPGSGAAPARTHDHTDGGLAWTRDGISLIDGEFRIPVTRQLSCRTAGAGPGPCSLCGHGRDRLAFVRGRETRTFTGYAPAARRRRSSSPPINEMQPQFSPMDVGSLFASPRGGGVSEIWLADADGQNPTRLTRGPGTAQGYPGWSPDGRSITFRLGGTGWQSRHMDHRLWMARTCGGSPAPARRHSAELARDGRFVYFTSSRTGPRRSGASTSRAGWRTS